MKQNMGSTDRVLRAIAAVLFAILYFTGTVPGTAGLLLAVVAVIFMGTSIVGFCPLYTVLGIKTKKA